jgi:diguanylate cyclase (GGDEF)-like protein
MAYHRRIRGVLRNRRLGIVLIATMLVVMSMVVVLGSIATSVLAGRAQNAVVISEAYENVADGVNAEESLDRQYRLEPGAASLAEHTKARDDVRDALEKVRSIGGPQDRLLSAKLLAENDQYGLAATAMFLAVDRHRPIAVVNRIDHGQVDPIYTLMKDQVDAAANADGARSLADVNTSRGINSFVLILNVASLLTAMAMIGVAGVSLSRSQRRLRAQSDLNRHQAMHDSLTGLPNRSLFQDRAAQALQVAARNEGLIAVMLVDLNRFKEVNDTLGHHYGDILLWQVAKRFSATMRAGDSVARLGGDEFAILLTSTTHDDAIAVADRLTEALVESFSVKEIFLDIDASIGIALAGGGAEIESVLRHADVAMYEAKSNHVPHVTYELDRDDHTLARLAVLGELRRAIANGELLLHFQPKVSTTTGELHSVEALVRWEHPTRGFLPPGAFVPIAEGTAVIHPLTEEILRLALIQVRSWLDRGLHIPVSVNISARSLLDLAFPTHIARLLETIGVPSDLLSLELTESAIMGDPERALTVLKALDAMGIALSIDDFGTGYSSMSYLKALPVRELKIDRSFVGGMATNDSDVVLVQSAVDLGHNLGFHVVAEGVEDAITQNLLAEMGCDLVQGFHIRHPVPAIDLEPWLRDHPTRQDASAVPVVQLPPEPHVPA